MLTLLDISKVYSMIQRLNSYNLLTDKVAEKVPWTIYRPDEKQKKYQSVRNELSIKGDIKALKYKSCLSFRACQKKIIEFTDSTHTIYWPTNIDKKIANCSNKLLNTFQYKQCLYCWHFQNVMNKL